MAWAGSGFSSQSIMDILGNTAELDWGSGTWNVALFPNTITPDYTVTAANFAYNAGVWTAAAELDDPANWPTGGPALTWGSATALTIESPAAGQVKLDADDVSQSSTTITDARGCLIYMGSIATPVADQGLLAVDFGSLFSTTNGTFAITWDANGVAYFDVW